MGLQHLPHEIGTSRNGISSFEGKLQYKGIGRSVLWSMYVYVKGYMSHFEREKEGATKFAERYVYASGSIRSKHFPLGAINKHPPRGAK